MSYNKKYEEDRAVVAEDTDHNDSGDDDDGSDYVSYVEGGCYFPQCFGGCTTFYLIYAIIVAVQLDDSDNSSTTILWSSDYFLATVACLGAIQVAVQSSHRLFSTVCFGGWSLGFILRGIATQRYYDNDVEYQSQQPIWYFFWMVAAYIVWGTSLFGLLLVLQASYMRLNNDKQKEHDQLLPEEVPWLSTLNALRGFTVVVGAGTVIVIGGSAWAVLDTGSNASAVDFASIWLWTGQVIMALSYTLFFIVAAILWKQQAKTQVVYLSDFFLPPSLAANMLFWSQVIAGICRLVLLVNNLSVTITIDQGAVTPFILSYMTMTTLCCCHNLILSFFPQLDWDDCDVAIGEELDTDQAEHKNSTLHPRRAITMNGKKPLANGKGEDDDWDKENGDNWEQNGDMEGAGYHYEIETNSVVSEQESIEMTKYFKRRAKEYQLHQQGKGKRVLTKKGEENPYLFKRNKSVDSVQVLYGDGTHINDFETSDDSENSGRNKNTKSKSKHVYGKYDNFVFGQDVEKNMTMIDPLARPRKAVAESNDEIVNSDDDYPQYDEPHNMLSSAQEVFARSSILPTTVPDRHDDGFLDTNPSGTGNETSKRSMSSHHQNAVTNRKSISKSVAMDGKILHDGDEGNGKQPKGSMKAAMVDFIKTFRPVGRSHKKRASVTFAPNLDEYHVPEPSAQAPTRTTETKLAMVVRPNDTHDNKNRLRRAREILAEPAMLPCNSSIEDIQESIKAASATLSDATMKFFDDATMQAMKSAKAVNTVSSHLSQTGAEAVTRVSSHISATSGSILERVSSAWTGWTGNDDATLKNIIGNTGLSSSPSLTDASERVVEAPKCDYDSLSSDSSSRVPIRNIVIPSNYNESVRFRDDEIGSVVSQAIKQAIADGYYVEKPNVSGQKANNAVRVLDGKLVRNTKKVSRGFFSLGFILKRSQESSFGRKQPLSKSKETPSQHIHHPSRNPSLKERENELFVHIKDPLETHMERENVLVHRF